MSAVLSTPWVWLALDPVPHSSPALAIFASVMILLTLPLSILAIVLGRSARRRASMEPETSAIPNRGDLWLGLAAITVWVLVLALTLPILASNGRGRGRDLAARWNLREGLTGLATAYAGATEMPEDRRVEALERFIASQKDVRNPWDRSQPGLHPRLLTSGRGEAAALAVARQQAIIPGQVVFALSAPSRASDPRWLAGAVKTWTMAGVISKTTRLEP